MVKNWERREGEEEEEGEEQSSERRRMRDWERMKRRLRIAQKRPAGWFGTVLPLMLRSRCELE